MTTNLLVRISMKPEHEGGRHAAFTLGYCPHFVVDGTEAWLGVRASKCPAPVEPGDTAEVGFELIYPAVDYSAVRKGANVRVMEGARSVDAGVVLDRFEEE